MGNLVGGAQKKLYDSMAYKEPISELPLQVCACPRPKHQRNKQQGTRRVEDQRGSQQHVALNSLSHALVLCGCSLVDTHVRGKGTILRLRKGQRRKDKRRKKRLRALKKRSNMVQRTPNGLQRSKEKNIEKKNRKNKLMLCSM